jgi:two-component system, response regulator FlrC
MGNPMSSFFPGSEHVRISPEAFHHGASHRQVARPEMVFRDPAMAAVIARADRAARSDASVLISGSSGTGKEVLARYVHQRSSRGSRAFVGVNCAAIPETLLESELFGHEKGAFSGAISRRIGKFEAATTGSLLLDEITEINLGLQAKLLRAIQEREIDRIGGSQPVRVDVRILATTNRDILNEVRRSTFREDLFYRLHVLAITLPDLKDRPGDIMPLAENFLAKHSMIEGPKSLAADAVALMRSYHWPGNVRELENVIHRASVLTDEAVICAEALEISLCNDHPADLIPLGSGPPPTLRGAPDEKVKLKTLEREAIMLMLKHNDGNRTKTAAALGISIRTLRNKLNRYGQE